MKLISTQKRYPNFHRVTTSVAVHPTIELQCLNVSGNKIKSPAVLSLFKHALSKYSKLTYIDISKNPLGSTGIKAMMEGIQNPNNL